MTALAIDRSSPVPIYHQLGELIREQVRAGSMPPGTKLPSEVDLARDLGISPMTVRQAYGELATAGVVVRRHGKGTFIQAPAAIPAPRPRRTSTDLMLVFTSYAALPYHIRLLESLAAACEAAGWNLHVSCHRERGLDHQANAVIATLLGEGHIDAVLAGGSLPLGDLERLAASRMPLLLLDRDCTSPGVAAVRFDDEGFLRRAVAALARQGCRRVGLINGPPAEPGSPFLSRGERLLAHMPAACAEHGLVWDPALLVPCATHAEAEAEAGTAALVDRGARPDALITHGDPAARAARRALVARGLELPVLTFADDPSDPGAVVAKPFAALASAAVALLRDLLAGREPPQRRLIVPLPPESP